MSNGLIGLMPKLSLNAPGLLIYFFSIEEPIAVLPPELFAELILKLFKFCPEVF